MTMTKKDYLKVTRNELAFFMEMIRSVVYDKDVKFDMCYDIISDYGMKGTAVLNFARFGAGIISKKNYDELYKRFTQYVNHYRNQLCNDYSRKG